MTTADQAFSHSPDAQVQRQQELLALLRQTAPEVVSDNQIDIQRLKELLGQDAITGAEHYELNWAGKSAARREIQNHQPHLAAVCG
jgi:adenine-specific DNA-methyltransferase